MYVVFMEIYVDNYPSSTITTAPANVFKACACLKLFYFIKVNAQIPHSPFHPEPLVINLPSGGMQCLL